MGNKKYYVSYSGLKGKCKFIGSVCITCKYRLTENLMESMKDKIKEDNHFDNIVITFIIKLEG